MSWNIGDTLLGKYRVERVLGQGGMGVVLAARHLELGDVHAIKMMHMQTREADDSASRFLREARASARLKNEHVARVYDVGRMDDGTLFMIMEHLEGKDLKTYLAENGRLPFSEAIDYILQACEGIGEAHENDIVHRDIKPANLFLVRKRKTGQLQVKVLDFGISKEMNASRANDLTQSGMMLGSPLYMSPEQMVYAREVDARTDIWSLGVVLYELISGKVPFPGDSMTQVVHSVTLLEPKPIRAHVPEAPLALESVLAQCLKKDPDKRFQSIDQLVDALHSVLKDEPVVEPSSVPTVKENAAQLVEMALEKTTVADTVEPTKAAPTPQLPKSHGTLALSKTELAESPPVPSPEISAPFAKTLLSESAPTNVTKNDEFKRNSRFLYWAFIFTIFVIAGYWMMNSRQTTTVTNAVESASLPVVPPMNSIPVPVEPSANSTLPVASVMVAESALPPILAQPANSAAKTQNRDDGITPPPPLPPKPPAPPAPNSSTTTKKPALWGNGPL